MSKTKYPWTALAIVVTWIAAALTIVFVQNVNLFRLLFISLGVTLVFAVIGFRTPQ